MSARVCVVGALHRDIVVRASRFPKPGETVLGEDFSLYVGGKGANQAVAASRLGARVTMVGALGEDEWGRAVRAALAAEAVDLTHVKSVERTHTGVGVITVVPGGENTIVVAPGADHALTVADIERASGVIADADALLVQGEVRAEITLAAMEIARNANTDVVYNAAPAGALPKGFLSHVDVLVANHGEATLLVGDPEGEIVPAGLARRLTCQGPGRVVVTLGDEGALLFNGTELEQVDPFQVESIDMTGAGDAFVAALTVLCSEGGRLKDSVRFACAAGALTTTRMGAIAALPTREAVEELLRRRKGSRSS